MLGAAGALCCFAGGTAIGFWMRERRLARLRMLHAQEDALGCMRMLLEQERPPLPELLRACAAGLSGAQGARQAAQRFRLAAERLEADPLSGAAGAYAAACAQIEAPWERAEERAAMELLFRQIGSGTASVREQCAAACLRRIRPLAERARTEAESGGRLCMQLGALLGLMAGIALW